MADPSAARPTPARRFSFRQMLPTLVFDVVLPIVIFNVLTRHGVSTLLALVAGGLSPVINNLRMWIRSRRLEPLGVIVIGFLAIGTAISLITGSVFVVLVKESVFTATFGLICLFSLLAERPLLFYIVRQFVAGDDQERLDWWNGFWQYPSFRTSQRVATAVWGIAYLIEALARVFFALTLTPAQVVVISPAMGFGVLIVLIVWTQRYLTAVGDRRRAQQQSEAG
jgi:hypothetical protein